MAVFDYKDIMEEENLATSKAEKATNSFEDLLTKYPEMITNFGTLPFDLRRENEKKLEDARRGDVGYMFESSKIINNPLTQENIKKSIERSAQLKELLKNPDLDAKTRERLENELLAYSRTNLAGRGGTEEMQMQMREMDMSSPENKYDTSGRGGTKDAKTLMEAMDTRTDGQSDEEVIEEVTLKQRMANLFGDADKRDAILGGIADAMLETRVGADAYGSRFGRAQKNVRDNLKLAEATQIARDKAQLDAMKTLAETDKLTNPAQYLSSAQKEADSIVRAQIASGQINQEDYAKAYASTLKQIAVKDLTSAKAGAIGDLYTYSQALMSTQPETAKLLQDAITQISIYLTTDGGVTGSASYEDADIIIKK